MGIFDRIKEPIILKEDSSAKEQLESMEQLLANVSNSKDKTLLENDISAIKAGIYGENTILFELKNSHIPMFVLHDLYLEYEGLTAQIDFLIITRKRHFIVECKNLYGNITVSNTGDFIRMIGSKKEGIYSPVTQGKRHLELIKQIRCAEKGSFLTKALFERYFYENYRSVVVFANTKTVFDAKYAPKEIKNQVIRADQLIKHIQEVNGEHEAVASSESDMEKLANFFLAKHCICKTDYVEKYKKIIQSSEEKVTETAPKPISPVKSSGTLVCPKCSAPMIKRKASRGNNAGGEFWGCSQFPRCRGIINIMNQDNV